VEKDVIPRRSLLEKMDTRVRAQSGEKTEMGQVRTKCADWWEDGGVRSVRVKTAGGVFHRPVTKICLLEGANDDE